MLHATTRRKNKRVQKPPYILDFVRKSADSVALSREYRKIERIYIYILSREASRFQFSRRVRDTLKFIYPADQPVFLLQRNVCYGMYV